VRCTGIHSNSARNHGETVSQRRESTRLRSWSPEFCAPQAAQAQALMRVADFRWNRAGIDAMSSPLVPSARFIAFLSNGRPRNFAPVQHQPVCLSLLATALCHLSSTSLAFRSPAVRYFWGWQTLHRTTRACTPILAHLPRSAPVASAPFPTIDASLTIYQDPAGAKECCGP
jgi:hypothetical protein